MRSRLNESKPGVARRSRPRGVTLAGSCVRPSAASTCGTIDCTPKLSRFTPPPRYARSSAAVDGVGVALDRDLGAGRQRDARRARASALRRARATACRRRRTRSSPRAARRRPLGRCRRRHASRYASIEVDAVGPGREGAVVAPLRAERDVDVDAEGRRVRRHDQGRGGRRPRSSSRRRGLVGLDVEDAGDGPQVVGRIVSTRPLKSCRCTWIIAR